MFGSVILDKREREGKGGGDSWNMGFRVISEPLGQCLVGRDGQREEEDRLLAIMSPRPQLAVPVLLQTYEPVLVRVLFGDVRVVMVFFNPF